jgi:hypothetical protein
MMMMWYIPARTLDSYVIGPQLTRPSVASKCQNGTGLEHAEFKSPYERLSNWKAIGREEHRGELEIAYTVFSSQKALERYS